MRSFLLFLAVAVAIAFAPTGAQAMSHPSVYVIINTEGPDANCVMTVQNNQGDTKVIVANVPQCENGDGFSIKFSSLPNLATIRGDIVMYIEL